MIIKENKKANSKDSFIIYYELGANRSLGRVREQLGKNGIKISETSLEKWSSRDEWVKRVKEMDNEVEKATEELAIKNATRRKSQILADTKAVMVAGIQAIKNKKIIPTPSDYKKMWEIMRVELGLDTDSPTTQNNTFIQINQKVIKIVDEAENKLKEALMQENEAPQSPHSDDNE